LLNWVSKISVEKWIEKKNEIKSSCDQFFFELYNNFLKDSLDEIVLDSDENEVLFFNLKLEQYQLSAIHYNPQ